MTKDPELGLKLANNPKGKKVDITFFKLIVGSLMYLTATRPDIMFAVSLISRFMEHPTELHVLAAKRILHYLKGTTDLGVFYKKGEKSDLMGFIDSDYIRDVNDRSSTSGYVFIMGSGVVSWSSKKQQVVASSITEAEFIAGASCACQAVWLSRILGELNFPPLESTAVYCDNSSTIKLSKNPVLHGRSKHIDVRYHFLHDLTKDGIIELVHCRSEDQIANILAMPLKIATFMRLLGLLGMYSLEEVIGDVTDARGLTCWSFLCKLMS